MAYVEPSCGTELRTLNSQILLDGWQESGSKGRVQELHVPRKSGFCFLFLLFDNRKLWGDT